MRRLVNGQIYRSDTPSHTCDNGTYAHLTQCAPHAADRITGQLQHNRTGTRPKLGARARQSGRSQSNHRNYDSDVSARRPTSD